MYGRKKRRNGPNYISDRQLILALKRNDGILTNTANDLGISLAAVSYRVNRGRHHKSLRKILEVIRDSVLDRAEQKHFEKIDEGDSKHILYHLETQGRKRGYGKQVDMTVRKSEEMDWKIEIVHKIDDSETKLIDCNKMIGDTYATVPDTT